MQDWSSEPANDLERNSVEQSASAVAQSGGGGAAAPDAEMGTLAADGVSSRRYSVPAAAIDIDATLAGEAERLGKEGVDIYLSRAGQHGGKRIAAAGANRLSPSDLFLTGLRTYGITWGLAVPVYGQFAFNFWMRYNSQ